MSDTEFDPQAIALNQTSGRLFGNTLLTEEDIVRAAAPYDDVSGVYFLVLGREVVYVGQSRNAMARIQAHRKRIKFTRFAFLPTPREHLDVVESLYIHLLRPRCNVVSQTAQGVAINAPLSLDRLLTLALKGLETTSPTEAVPGAESREAEHSLQK